VLSLQQQTQARLTDLCSASEAALHQAAQVLLQELQLENPSQLAAAAAAFMPSKGSPAVSDMAIELSLAALQHQPEAAQSLQQQRQGLQPLLRQEPAPALTTADMTLVAHCRTGSNMGAQHSGVSCCSRASTRSQRSAAASEGPDALDTGALRSPVGVQRKQAAGEKRASLEALDAQLAPLQDQVGLQTAPEPPQQQQHSQCCVAQAGWSQQLQAQPQEQEHSHHKQEWAETTQPADWPPANSTFSMYSSAGSAVCSPSVAAAHAESPGGLRGFQQGAWQGRPRSSSSSQRHSTHDHRLPASVYMARPARTSSAGVHSRPAFAAPTDTPQCTQLWQPAGDNQASQQQQQQQQAAPRRELKALLSLPVTRQHALTQPTLRRCVSTMGPPSILLKSAASLRQQLESSWGAGLAKQAAKAAASSAQELQAGATMSARLSRQHSRKAHLAAGISSGSDSDEGVKSPNRRQHMRSNSARGSDQAKRWLVNLHNGEQQPDVERVVQSAAGSSKRQCADADLGTSAGRALLTSNARRAGALCRSSGSAAGRLAGSSVLELLD
jgi:hypothetical protein